MERHVKALMTALMIALAAAPGLLVLLAGPVNAQFKSVGADPKDQNAGSQKKKSSEDGHYKSAIERMPDKKFDPWQNMR